MKISWRKHERRSSYACVRLAHIFLLSPVMSLEALTIRSRRSWCSSNSLRKLSNIDMKGDAGGDDASSLAGRCLWSVIVDQLLVVILTE